MITIDIETECTVPGCKGPKCTESHALNPATSRITVVGLSNVFGDHTLMSTRDLSLVSTWIQGKHLCAFNFKFEHLHLNYHGVHIDLNQWVADPMLMAYVSTNKISDQWLANYEANRPSTSRKAGKHSLKTLAPHFLGVAPYWETEDKDNDEYVLTDVQYTQKLAQHLGNSMDRDEYVFYYEKLLPWTKMLVEAEQRGVTIDLAALVTLERDLVTKSDQLKAKLDEQWSTSHARYHQLQLAAVEEKYAHQKVNASWGKRQQQARERCATHVDYDSPKQMLWLLRDFYKYDCTTFEGDQSTGKEVLQRLAADGHDDVQLYLEWRSVNKILSAFIPTYRELARPFTLEGEPPTKLWKINPVYNPANTRTGRTSSERPNMQQVPPALRPLFRARPGYKLVGYDMGAIEAKLIAYYTEDPVLTQLIKTGVSLHDYNAKVFFELDCEISEIKSKYPAHRAAAKNVGFALFYNAGYNRIKVAFAQKGFHLSDGQCKAIHKRFRAAYEQAIAYADQVVETFEQGEIVPNLLGRPLKIENRDDCYMQGFNTLIQSSATDLLLDSAERALTHLRSKQIEVYPVLFVHDYVCFEVEEHHAPYASERLAYEMTCAELGGIPLTVEGGISERWEK